MAVNLEDNDVLCDDNLTGGPDIQLTEEAFEITNQDVNKLLNIDLNVLEESLQLDTEELILRIMNNSQAFSDFATAEDTKDNELMIIVRLLAVICESPLKDIKCIILTTFLKEPFVFNLYKVMGNLSKNEDFSSTQKAVDFWRHLIQVCDGFLHAISGDSLKILHILLQSLKTNIPMFEAAHKIKLESRLKKKVKNMITEVSLKTKEEKKKMGEIINDVMEHPPDDFRKISIYPNNNEMLDKQNFLRPNVVGKPYQDINQYLDIQFRLLREDSLRPLKKVIQQKKNSGANVTIHRDVTFLRLEPINQYFCYLLSFNVKKRFFNGSLVAFTKDNFNTAIFGRIYDRYVRDLQGGQAIIEFDQNVSVSLHESYLMVECKVFFEPYFQVLKCLQSMTVWDFPMEKYLIDLNLDPTPPKYMNQDNCVYAIKGHHFEPLGKWNSIVSQSLGLDEPQSVAFRSALTQEFAIIHGPPGTGKTYVGLKLVETLLQNRRWWHYRSPLLIIFHTNHALDQFLEGVSQYTRKIIRVGGRLTKDAVKDFSLGFFRNIRNSNMWVKLKESNKIAAEIRELSKLLEEMDSFESVISFRLFEEVKTDSWFYYASPNKAAEWLMEGTENFATQVEFDKNMETRHILNSSKNEKDDFSIISLKSLRNEVKNLETTKPPNVRQKILDVKKKYEYLAMRLNQGKSNKDKMIEQPKTVNTTRFKNIKPDDRWNLYFYWLMTSRKKLIQKRDLLYEEYQTVYKEIEELRSLEVVKSMRNAFVVGMTTTMAARYNLVLQTLQCPIVIVEEAAKILEAHVVTSITKHCQHLILIGDHHQLRPKTTDTDIQNKCNLNISLFERIILNSDPDQFNVLTMQHRMNPNIAILLSPIYNFLESHPSMLTRPPVNGVEKCLFFLDCDTVPKSGKKSRTDFDDVSFLIYLAKYLILNGYTSDNITILAMHVTKILEFKQEISNHAELKNIRVSLLDHYQGEECDIILLSLIGRATKSEGYSEESRICVALSRAKIGLYMVGSFKKLCKHEDLWTKVEIVLENQRAIGPKLPLQCQTHPEIVTYVGSEYEFKTIPNGGCKNTCGVVLKCGHKCKWVCHMENSNHQNYQCEEKCGRLLCENDLNHICQKECYKNCGSCKYIVQKLLPCGHETELECYKYVTNYKCPVLTLVDLPCGHQNEKQCHQPAEITKCVQPCDAILSCGHNCGLLCHTNTDPDHLNYICKKRCAKYSRFCTTKEDSHKCKKLCYEECQLCTIPVKKQRSECSHVVEAPCHSDVNAIECREACLKILPCGHQCKKRCFEKCGECDMKVSKTYPLCKHTVKTKCSEVPNQKNCTKKCPLSLPCGHPCTVKCNEPCSTICTAMVECSIPADCGHPLTQIKCHKLNETSSSKFCNQLCNTILSCGHSCSGNCRDCFQGRFHKICEEKIKVSLICGHEHQVFCKEALNPCMSKCLTKCAHTSCSKSCGEVCTPCKKNCSRNCIHQKCTQKCGDFCDVSPCKEPCENKLKCGHDCVGFCGDPCPSKCLICDENYFESFSKKENEKYVLLNDCKHVVPNSNIENLDEKDLEFKVCVICQTPIISTQRYSEHAKKVNKRLSEIKIRIYGTSQENEEMRYNLVQTFFTLKQKSGQLISDLTKIKNTLEMLDSHFTKMSKNKQKPLSKYMLETFTSKLSIIEYCINSAETKQPLQIYSISQINFILSILKREQLYFTGQEFIDLELELKKFARMGQLNQLKSVIESTDFEEMETEAEKYFQSSKRYSEDDAIILRLNSLVKSYPQIVMLESFEIFEHFGFRKDDWFVGTDGRILRKK